VTAHLLQGDAADAEPIGSPVLPTSPGARRCAASRILRWIMARVLANSIVVAQPAWLAMRPAGRSNSDLSICDIIGCA